jgi:glycosyltransferase involved in cell wall biosynthesis
VLPSDTEGLPGVLMEAGLTAIPAVATDVGWVREVVLDGTTGYVVARGDTNAIASALTNALVHGEELGAAARRHCLARFDLAGVADRWADLLLEVTSDAIPA